MGFEKVVEYVDKVGRPFLIGVWQGSGRPPLDVLYEEFEPKACAQGLPPAAREDRARWLERLRVGAVNLLARVDHRVVGHAALLEIEPGGRCEYLIFVHQAYRNRGIGTGLTEAACRLARSSGYRALWLCVAATNLPAIRVYLKVGFRVVGPPDTEREMFLDLASLSGCSRAGCEL